MDILSSRDTDTIVELSQARRTVKAMDKIKRVLPYYL